MSYRAGVGAPLVGALARCDGSPRRRGKVVECPVHSTFCNERPPGTPSPDPLRLMKTPSRATLSPKGERAGWRGRGG